MTHPIGNIKTVVRIVNSIMIRLSDGSYEIIIDLEALDCIGAVTEIEARPHNADDMIQAWNIVQMLRPGSIHSVEGSFLFEDKGFRFVAPVYSPYRGDIDNISECFSHHSSREFASALQAGGLKTVSGHIKKVQLEKTKQDGDIAIIHLAERDDYGLVIFPDLFETYKSIILRGDYLEYCGIPQECYMTGDSSETMIFVTAINVADQLDETENIDYGQ